MDRAAADEGAAWRSAFVRAAIRDRVDRVQPTGHIHGSITVAYAHGEESRISEVRHMFHDVVLSMMHTHCDPSLCMDVLLVGGDAARVVALHHQLECMRQVNLAVLVPITSQAGDANDAAP
jgi:CopG family nickel-responsive transcriptional regulator